MKKSKINQLSKEESTIIDMKIALSKKFSTLRKSNNLTQVEAAKMETGDPSVSIDLLIKGMITLGANKKSVAQTFANS